MAIEYTDAIDGDGLFDILGQYFGAFAALGTVRATTVASQVQQAVLQYKKKSDATLEFDRAIQAAASAERSWRVAGDTLAAALQADAVALLQEFVRSDSGSVRINLSEALEYLVGQMIADDVFVAASSVAVGSITADAGNSVNDLGIRIGLTDRLGRSIQTALPETLRLTCTQGGQDSGDTAFQLVGERPARSKLAEDWPAGSGINRSLTPLVPDTLLANGGFEDAAIDHVPDNWIVASGTPGTTVMLTGFEVQSVAISGTPTSGVYHLTFTHPLTGVVRSTPALDFNAGGSAVQAALRTIPGLEQVTVETTGTSPNFTHTITFTGLAGNLATMGGSATFDTGSIAIDQVTAGENLAIQGRGLKFTAHASLEQAVYQQVQLDPDKVYFLGYWWTPSTNPAGGTFEVAITQSIGGLTLSDRQGNLIRQQTDTTGISAKTSGGFFFALPPSVATAGPVYVAIRKTDPEATADLVYDHVVLVEATELYAGGPFAALLGGQRPPIAGDTWLIPIENDLAGLWQRYFDQFFDLANKRLVLPTAGTTEIPQALIG